MRFLSALVAVIALTACSNTDPATPPEDLPVTEATAEPELAEEGDAAAQPLPEGSAGFGAPDGELVDDVLGDPFGERDEFLAVQGVPLEGQLVEPVTPEQEEFISAQRDFIADQGGQWDEQHTEVYLSLALDGCETAILNGHDPDPAIISTHITTSPLFSNLLAGQTGDALESGITNLLSSTIFGMQHLCPDDGADWLTIAAGLYPDHFG